jgi:hypothetical protein
LAASESIAILRCVRHKRQNKRKRVAPWPADAPDPEALSREVSYVGSAEHKDHPTTAGPPRLRTDASACDSRYQDLAVPTQALREAIRTRQVSDFCGRFPKYAWGLLDGQLYEARVVNHELGQYKGYPISAGEAPDEIAGLAAGWEP